MIDMLDLDRLITQLEQQASLAEVFLVVQTLEARLKQLSPDVAMAVTHLRVALRAELFHRQARRQRALLESLDPHARP